jgi:AbiV family abortive infection protein
LEEKKRPQPPKPGIKLYENLFVGLDHHETLQRISDGIHAVISNASRLLEEVELLVGSDHFATASFLLATADEEMAKIYILLDMCRLDFSKHENKLKNLCRAFYDHVAKCAYNEILRFGLQIRDMRHVKEIWIAEITRWWPSGYESGEPDFPHDTYFKRELPLYVDFIEFDQNWHIPQHDTNKFYFNASFGEDIFSKSKAALKRLRKTADLQFFGSKYLKILNDTFRKRNLSEDTETEFIIALNNKVYARLPKKLQNSFKDSALFEWPLYPFVHILR